MSELLTVPEAMHRLRLSRWMVYNLIRSGELESVTIGRCRRIPDTAINDYITRLRQEVG
ncbi:MAG: helix-turn-helix domain-containing protein [Carbonactinosporaceae bacterium]